MLKQLRMFERTSKILILAFVALMAFSLVLFFRPGGSSSAVEPTKSSEVVATVNGEDITLGEFATQKQNLQMRYSQFGGQISLARLGLTDDKILDGLIQRKIAVQEARRLGLDASPAEVNERIRKTFSDAGGKLTFVDASGNLDMAKYEQRVGDVAAFERGVQCILKCQIVVGGKRTAWCAQHDENDYRPRAGRTFELASLSGAESVGVVRLLMSLDDPSPDVIKAVEGRSGAENTR